MAEFIEIGENGARRRIAVEARAATERPLDPPIVWLGGFRSDMRGGKAERLDAYAARTGRACVRFDYMGHGESSGRFEDGTISLWLEDALAVIARFVGRPPILVGSSMGGWIALLVARALAGTASAPAGMVLIAPAADFTERLMWAHFPKAIRETIEREGVYAAPSEYGEPTPITRALIEDGRRHLLMDGPIVTGCPVHILQGMQDPDVPWRHVTETMEAMASDSVTMTLVKDGDHRLSREEDLDRLEAAVARMIETAGEG
ncbi:alpha/beta hydrolase [Salinarimonas ramus]|uniref:Palmitoyl-protein thioesterase ABHD10, mitochondrial n=1 Tax=Salinarimonas ramus TaxID=690164 RepID=A0A917Q958_9HYPH|nr:alpha/beta hydrolase [Salinarimonas ramus]GGK36884.1 alpha/beta hydrolase [Salinarimonas ramus]